MTKEEYEKLLLSDYWKGYSYSLIKERDFTCEDCGRRFFNERNKLQVHHLVYRDINPWSYKPEEVVVLCKECHERRHGIVSTPEPQEVNTEIQESGNYTKSYSYSQNNKQEKSSGNYVNSSSTTNIDNTNHNYDTNKSYGNNRNRGGYRYYRKKSSSKVKAKYILWGAAILFIILVALSSHSDDTESDGITHEATIQNEPDYVISSVPKNNTTRINTTQKSDEDSSLDVIEPVSAILDNEENIVKESVEFSESEVQKEEPQTKGEKTTLEMLEERNHANAVKRAKEVGVSTEGSTLDILERINHANTVKRAKEVGVSTEGTTLDILERINRKHLENYK